MATAFLRKDGAYLLLKRLGSRVIADGVWSGVGGHLEECELNDPYAACLREIREETGIEAGDIRGLTLRYIIVRRRLDEVRLNYVYFGETCAEPSLVCDEGELSWVDAGELLERGYTPTFAAMLRHYVCSPVEDRVVVGVAREDGGECLVDWAELSDWER